MDTIELSVDTRELEAALKALPLKLRGPIMRRALQAGGDVLVDALVAHAPERTDEPTPGGTSLPPGILKADLHTEIVLDSTHAPRVKAGPSKIAGHVARWQNDGFNLTTHGRSRRGRKVIKAIPGKHFIEAAFDQSAQTAVDLFLSTLANGLFGTGDENSLPEDNYSGENY